MPDWTEYAGVLRSMVLEFSGAGTTHDPRAVLCAWVRRLATVVGANACRRSMSKDQA